MQYFKIDLLKFLIKYKTMYVLQHLFFYDQKCVFSNFGKVKNRPSLLYMCNKPK